MKTKETEKNFDALAMFAMTNEEMITVRGGGEDGGPGTIPPPPPVKI